MQVGCTRLKRRKILRVAGRPSWSSAAGAPPSSSTSAILRRNKAFRQRSKASVNSIDLMRGLQSSHVWADVDAVPSPVTLLATSCRWHFVQAVTPCFASWPTRGRVLKELQARDIEVVGHLQGVLAESNSFTGTRQASLRVDVDSHLVQDFACCCNQLGWSLTL
jgi:hypothetical protein